MNVGNLVFQNGTRRGTKSFHQTFQCIDTKLIEGGQQTMPLIIIIALETFCYKSAFLKGTLSTPGKSPSLSH